MTDVVRYGSHRAQFAELTRPDNGVVPRAGVVALIHGGFWRARYGLDLGRPLARDLAARGFICWNIEYRRVGDGGGWPTTLEDVAAALDALASQDVDLSGGVVAVGHSAGGHLATWAASQGTPLTGVVAQAGVIDLAAAARERLGDGATQAFLGGEPDEVPDRYAAADPTALVPPPVPVLCVHGRDDDTVPMSQSQSYVAAASAAGGDAALHEVDGDHMTMIDPSSQAWALVRDALPWLLRSSV